MSCKNFVQNLTPRDWFCYTSHGESLVRASTLFDIISVWLRWPEREMTLENRKHMRTIDEAVAGKENDGTRQSIRAMSLAESQWWCSSNGFLFLVLYVEHILLVSGEPRTRAIISCHLKRYVLDNLFDKKTMGHVSQLGRCHWRRVNDGVLVTDFYFCCCT